MKKQLTREALVVEDEPITRMVAANAISEVGVNVFEASDAGEALQPPRCVTRCDHVILTQ